MKLKISIIISLLIIIIASFNVKNTISGNNTIYYDAKNKTFNYFNINKNDIFDGFKDMIPGDTKEQSIKIKILNKSIDTDLYIRINKELSKDALKYINIHFYKDGEELIKNEELYKVTNFKNEDEIELKVKVEVPKETNNEIENLSANLSWEFLVEENGDLKEVPYTYDGSHLYLNLLLLLISIIVIIISLKKLKEEK